MTRSRWRRGAVVAVLLVGGTAAPAAAAAPVRPVSVALPRFAVAGLVEVPQGVVVLSLDRDGGTLQRFDPATGAVLAVRDLLPGTPTGNSFLLDDVVFAAGSLWVGEYWQDEVLRLDPTTLRTRAVIHTGRSPSGIVSGGGSIWVPLTNDQAVARIDPGSNAVVATIPVGSPANYVDSPYKAAWTGTDLVASLPASGRVAHVSPRADRVTYDRSGTDATACAAIHPVPGGYWLDDTDCSDRYYRWTASSASVTAVADTDTESPPQVGFGSAVSDGVFFTGECVQGHGDCTRAQLVGRDLATGAVVSRRLVAGDIAALPHLAAGAWWTDDVDHGVLHRSDLAAGGTS